MSRLQQSDQPFGPWEKFALGTCASLGPFPQVDLAPKFSPARLNHASRAYLRLQEDELLLALIGTEAEGRESSVALTSRGVYWEYQDREGKRNRRPRTTSHVTLTVDYAHLPDSIHVATSSDGSLQLDLGAGRFLPLPGVEARLASALATYLGTVSRAVRSGIIPSLKETDPELEARITGVLPAVSEISGRIRRTRRDFDEFRRDLLAATPHAPVTPVLVTACALVLAAMVIRGVPIALPSGKELMDWGANEGRHVVLRHEYWRLLTSVFVHGGILHLAVNMWCLLCIGPLVERLYGNAAFALLYLAAGLGGAVASVATPPIRVSVGASGAIFGMLGALLAFLIVRRNSVPASVLKPLRSCALSFVIFNTIFGAVVPNIDQAAHLGGLATGFLGGLLLSRPWPVAPSFRLILRQAAMSILLVLGVGTAMLGTLRWRERTIPPLVLFEDLSEQLSPALTEFNAISKQVPGVQQLLEGAEVSEIRDQLDATLKALQARGAANVKRFRGATTPDAKLRALRQTLIDGQTAQLSTLNASRQYLATRDQKWLTGKEGMFAGMTATGRANREFQARQLAYLQSSGIIAPSDDSRKDEVKLP